MSAWEDLTPATLKPVTYIYKYRHKIHEWLLKARLKFNVTTSPHILILGRSGTGKTVLLHHLNQEAYSNDWQLPETSSKTEFKAAEFGLWHHIVAVPPGQHTEERNVALQEALDKNSNLKGIIYLMDYGYTEIRSDAVKHDLVQQGFSDIESIRKKNLELELREFDDFLTILSHSIRPNSEPKWLLIGVNKIDLYYDRSNEAQRYYDPECNGKYKELIDKLYTKIDRSKLKIVCVPLCSLNEPFLWNNEQIDSKLNSTTRTKIF